MFFAVSGSVEVRTPPRGSDRVRSTGWCQFSTQILAGFCLTMSYAKKSPFSRTAADRFVSPGDAPANITQYVAWMERQFNACQTPRSMYLSISNTFRVIRCLSQCVSPKIAIFTTFCFSWGRPWGNHVKCCMDGKRIRCLQIVLRHAPIYLQQFPSYSNRKCKKSPFSRTAAHIFLSPGDAPATMTQNVASVERQFNACQTLRSMYLSTFNSF